MVERKWRLWRLINSKQNQAWYVKKKALERDPFTAESLPISGEQVCLDY